MVLLWQTSGPVALATLKDQVRHRGVLPLCRKTTGTKVVL